MPSVRSTAGEDHVSVIWGGDLTRSNVWYWLHINNTKFEQAADRVSSSFDTSRTRRQKGLVSAQCEIEYELSIDWLPVGNGHYKQQADWLRASAAEKHEWGQTPG